MLFCLILYLTSFLNIELQKTNLNEKNIDNDQKTSEWVKF